MAPPILPGVPINVSVARAIPVICWHSGLYAGLGGDGPPQPLHICAKPG